MKSFYLLVVLVAFSLTAATAQIASKAVVINEFSAASDSLSGITDPAGGYPDWIELFNNTDQSVDLSGVYLSDKADNLKKFAFPTGTTIPAGGYLIVWADEDEDEEGIHANFKLSRGGEALYLSNTADTSEIDAVVFGEQERNISSSRVPNGTGDFVMQHTTFGFSNDTPVSTGTATLDVEVNLFPNPVQDDLTVRLTDAAGEYELSVLSATGRTIITPRAAPADSTRFSLAALPSGTYLLKITDGRSGLSRLVRFVKQ